MATTEGVKPTTLPAEQKETLRRLAFEQNRPQQEVLAEAVDEYEKRQGRETKKEGS